MSNSSSAGGIGLLVIGFLAAAEIITLTTGMTAHWAFIIPGIIVGLLAVRVIR